LPAVTNPAALRSFTIFSPSRIVLFALLDGRALRRRCRPSSIHSVGVDDLNMHTRPSQHAEAAARSFALRTDQMNANREGAAARRAPRISGSGELVRAHSIDSMSVSGTP